MGRTAGVAALAAVLCATLAGGAPRAAAPGPGDAWETAADERGGRWVYVVDGAPPPEAHGFAALRALEGDDGGDAHDDDGHHVVDGHGDDARGNGTHVEHHDEHAGSHGHVHKVLVFLFMTLAVGALTLFLINHYAPALPLAARVRGRPSALSPGKKKKRK